MVAISLNSIDDQIEEKYVMVKNLIYALIMSIFLGLSACSTKTEEMPGDVISEDYENGGNVAVEDGSQTVPLEGDGDLSMGALGDGSSGNVIYFDYNSSQIRDESLPLITAAAEALAADATQQLRLEGHADERGTREYNLALGEQRAQSVRDLIMLQGVSGNQIDIVSYGEEKPAAVGSDETAWQQNRRVELIY